MHDYPYRKPWDCEAMRQQENPPKEPDFEKFNKTEPSERDLKFRHAQPFRNNLRDYR